jgi:predicted nucleotidyltransferase
MDTRSKAMKQLNEDIIDSMVQRLVQSLQPETIILFGSYATDSAGDESDIDILAVTDRRYSPAEQFALRRTLFPNPPLPVQLILMEKREFAETRGVIGGIAYPAAKYGKVVYEKP